MGAAGTSAVRSRGRAARPKGAAAPAGAGIAATKLDYALRSLGAKGEIAGERSRRLSVRVDPAVMDAAMRETGIESPSDLVNAALALAAAPGDFGAWLVTKAGRVPDDFELPIGRVPEDDDD